MVFLAAWWGLGYSALMVSTVAFGLYRLRRDKAIGLTGLILMFISTGMLWIGLIGRATRGHGWPLTSAADSAACMSLLVLLFYSAWKLTSPELETGFAVTAMALVLFAYGLGQQPPPLLTEPLPSTGVLVGTLLKLGGGALLALAAAVSIAPLIGSRRGSHAQSAPIAWHYTRAEHPPAPGLEAGSFRAEGSPHRPTESRNSDLQHSSETLVREALLCLAFSLAIDTWWLQKVGLGNANDAQQAGIALAWMVFFVALRLRTEPRWRGWPWALILTIGFVCTLPILINAPWLENTLPI